jgi:hypothetical protein
MIAHRLTLMLIALGAGNIACHRQPVLTTPATDQTVYATGYAERLRDVRARFTAAEDDTRKSFQSLRTLPESAPASNADEIEQLVRRADAAGRSQPYVDEALRQEEIDALMTENRNAIRRRIAGSVAFAAKERECMKKECVKEDVDALAGTAATATDRAVARQLEERLRSHNPAQRYLHTHADELGEGRVNALERRIDTLSRASFVANVRLHLYRLELDDLLEQEKAVRSTLERDEAENRATLGQEGLSKSYRVSLEEQVARDEAAREAIPSEVSASKGSLKDLEARAESLQKDYQALIDELLAELERRQAMAPEKPTGATAPAKAPAAKPAATAPEAKPAAAEPAAATPEPAAETPDPAPPQTTP